MNAKNLKLYSIVLKTFKTLWFRNNATCLVKLDGNVLQQRINIKNYICSKYKKSLQRLLIVKWDLMINLKLGLKLIQHIYKEKQILTPVGAWNCMRIELW